MTNTSETPAVWRFRDVPATRNSIHRQACYPRTKLARLLPILFLAPFLAVVPRLSAQDTGRSAGWRSWLAAQTNVQSWSADFTQTRTLKSLTQPLTATGRVWFTKPNRFRWEMGNPTQTLAVRRADELLVIYPRLQRVEKYPLAGGRREGWRDALALLEAGFPQSEADLLAQFTVRGESRTKGVVEVTLEPRSSAARKMIPRMAIAFDEQRAQLVATELHFADGSTMRNDFRNQAVNPSMAPDLFTPVIPADYKIVEPLKK